MADLVLIRPHCREASKTKRLEDILVWSLEGHNIETITTVEELQPQQNKRILFAVSLGESGINLELYGMLKKIRLQRDYFAGSVGGLILDGNSELYTKSIARELAFSANLAGCTFPGKPLVEGTRSLLNYNIVARNLDMDALQAYRHSARGLVDSVVSFAAPKKKNPKILALHASLYPQSNTLALWKMVKENLEGCEITEIGLRNGAVMDCIGCPYKTCNYFGSTEKCVYGGVIVEQVYPAIMACDALIMLCPNYNDAISANLSAFINRLTALLQKVKFYDKYLFGIVVSGYSGSDIVASQLLSGLNMNKTFILPGNFAMLETANDPGSIGQATGIEERAAAFAANIKDCLVAD